MQSPTPFVRKTHFICYFFPPHPQNISVFHDALNSVFRDFFYFTCYLITYEIAGLDLLCQFFFYLYNRHDCVANFVFDGRAFGGALQEESYIFCPGNLLI